MPQIRPISDLRNNFTEISRIVHDTFEPVYLTRNGYGDMVVMSVELYERLGIAAQLLEIEPQKDERTQEKSVGTGSLRIQKPMSRWQQTLSDLAKR